MEGMDGWKEGIAKERKRERKYDRKLEQSKTEMSVKRNTYGASPLLFSLDIKK